MCLVDKCFCISLRRAVIIFVVLDLILDCIDLIIAAIKVANLALYHIRVGESQENWIVAIVCFDVFVSTFDFLIVLIIIHGLYKENVLQLKIGMWWEIFQMCAVIVVFFVVLIRTKLIKGLYIVLFVFLIVFWGYQVVVLRSYIYSIQKKGTMPKPEEVLNEEEEMEEEAEGRYTDVEGNREEMVVVEMT